MVEEEAVNGNARTKDEVLWEDGEEIKFVY